MSHIGKTQVAKGLTTDLIIFEIVGTIEAILTVRLNNIHALQYVRYIVFCQCFCNRKWREIGGGKKANKCRFSHASGRDMGMPWSVCWSVHNFGPEWWQILAWVIWNTRLKMFCSKSIDTGSDSCSIQKCEYLLQLIYHSQSWKYVRMSVGQFENLLRVLVKRESERKWRKMQCEQKRERYLSIGELNMPQQMVTYYAYFNLPAPVLYKCSLILCHLLCSIFPTPFTNCPKCCC